MFCIQCVLHQIGAFADTRASTSIMNTKNDVLVPQLAIRDKNTILGAYDLLKVMEPIGYNNYYEYLNFYLSL